MTGAYKERNDKMTEFTLTTVQGDEQTVRLLDHVPTRVGIKTRSKMDVSASGEGKQVKYEMDNPQTKFEEAKQYLVEQMIEKSPGANLDLDDISYESFNEVAQHYWSQVQGERGKNSDTASDAT